MLYNFNTVCKDLVIKKEMDISENNLNCTLFYVIFTLFLYEIIYYKDGLNLTENKR